MILAIISAERLPLFHPSSTITTRWVFATDEIIVSVSRGRRMRKSMTSASIPSFDNSSAAFQGFMDHCTISNNSDIFTCFSNRRFINITLSNSGLPLLLDCKGSYVHISKQDWDLECRPKHAKSIRDCGRA